MFYEIDAELIKQTDKLKNKRWFRNADAECDLLVWEDKRGNVCKFQFWHDDALVEWDKDIGLRTGHVDKSSGAFQHYQSKLYRLHENSDEDLLNYVRELLNHVSTPGSSSFEDVRNILYEIANRDFGI